VECGFKVVWWNVGSRTDSRLMCLAGVSSNVFPLNVVINVLPLSIYAGCAARAHSFTAFVYRIRLPHLFTAFVYRIRLPSHSHGWLKWLSRRFQDSITRGSVYLQMRQRQHSTPIAFLLLSLPPSKPVSPSIF